MAHDGLSTGVARPRMRIGPWIMDAAFVGLLLLAFVGMEPFALRNPATDLSTGPYTATGMGDSVRQVFYIAIFVTIVTLAFLHRGLAVVTAVPPMLALLLAWCLASTMWAASRMWRFAGQFWRLLSCCARLRASTFSAFRER